MLHSDGARRVISCQVVCVCIYEFDDRHSLGKIVYEYYVLCIGGVFESKSVVFV